MKPASFKLWWVGVLAVTFTLPTLVFGQQAEPWQLPYTGKDAQGPHVLGFWRFETGHEKDDSSSHGQTLTLSGASIHAEGKFGSCLECFPAETDTRHSATIPNHARLSPSGSFSLEMWVQAKPELASHPRHVFLVDKKYVSDQDYQLILDPPAKDGSRSWKAVLGFGTESQTWRTDQPLKLEPGTWTHLAMTYDAAGTLKFYVNGVPAGGGFKAGRGPVAPGKRALSIGDRGGSSYAGFPGLIDEVRITTGVREFRPMSLVDDNRRHVFIRSEPVPQLHYRVVNLQRVPLENVEASIILPHMEPVPFKAQRIEPGAALEMTAAFDTKLRPDQYEVEVRVSAQTDIGPVTTVERVPVRIVPRQSPHRMPVVMWGLGGVEGLSKNFDQLKRIGFTHCLGLTCDYFNIWKSGQPVPPATPETIRAADTMLDTALAEDVGIIVSLSPGRLAETQKDLRRIDREGKETGRENLANISPDLETYFYNVGASVAKTWGSHPALRAALVDTEIRDRTAPSFHPQERKAFKDFAGFEIPDDVKTSRGVSWTKIKDFPANRILPDNDPLLTYYRWFWKAGDGWNGWHSALHRGFHSADAQRTAGAPLWTFFDPAARAPSIYGSGGDVDYLSHWTYTYPDPIRIGLCADELATMAAGSTRKSPQQIMKMTQLIWYRSQTAPNTKTTQTVERSPWEDFDPDAAYITIAPMHLREALWMKLSRPVQGIMYHGWGSLVPSSSASSYRYTHPDTQLELARLINTVVEPLGPALRQIPSAPADVALLESFTSQMFAGRGTYGWGQSWAADYWHVLQYAHLPTEILYEETLLRNGLDQYRVLVLPDCDVLTEPVAEAIRKFQQRGGIVVGDSRLAPGIKADVVLTPYARQRKDDVDQARLIAIAEELNAKLKGKYQSPITADQPDVIVHQRQAGDATYLFAINDRREFGDYVGQHGMVMENGKPAATMVSIQRPQGFVYDLRRHQPVTVQQENGTLRWPVTLAPADGALFLITSRPIEQLQIQAAEQGTLGAPLPVTIRLTDRQNQNVDAVVPLHVEILDSNGRTAEFSGYHAAVNGELTLPLEIASNDSRGVWTISVKELASGKMTQHFVSLR